MYMRKGNRYLGYETEMSLHWTEPKVYRQTNVTQVKRIKSDLPTKVLFVCLSLHVEQTEVRQWVSTLQYLFADLFWLNILIIVYFQCYLLGSEAQRREWDVCVKEINT